MIPGVDPGAGNGRGTNWLSCRWLGRAAGADLEIFRGVSGSLGLQVEDPKKIVGRVAISEGVSGNAKTRDLNL